MTCRVDRFLTEEGAAVLRLSGRITDEDVDVLRAALEQETGAVEIDLRDVSLIDREAVTVLAFSEGNRIGLRNCPAYIREWIDRERAHTKSTESE
jgi:ABC-type transporter Mla MlaB component